jgi:hypothetical protein
MTKFAATTTTPVTKAAMQENSTTSIISLIILPAPPFAQPRAIPVYATLGTWPNGDGRLS